MQDQKSKVNTVSPLGVLPSNKNEQEIAWYIGAICKHELVELCHCELLVSHSLQQTKRCFKQIEIGHHLDEQVQPSYILSHTNQLSYWHCPGLYHSFQLWPSNMPLDILMLIGQCTEIIFTCIALMYLPWIMKDILALPRLIWIHLL